MAKKVLNVKYDANSATVEELCSIPRIGKNVAELIVSMQPNLTSIQDLDKKPGLGAKKLETLAEYLTFGETAKKTPKKEESTETLLTTSMDESPKEVVSEVVVEADVKSEEDQLKELIDLI